MKNLYVAYVLEVLAMVVIGLLIILGVIVLIYLSKSLFEEIRDSKKTDIPNFMRK